MRLSPVILQPEKSVIENLIKDAKEKMPNNDNLSNPTPRNIFN